MNDILQTLLTWPLAIVALAVFGFFPGVFARLIALSFHKDDPRRKELIAEVYAVPRWERPFWVAEQLERALAEGAWERLVDAADGRLFNRWMLGDGVAMNRSYPDSFWIPEVDDLEQLRVGDHVKLVFEARGKMRFRDDPLSAERMWVRITRIDGDKYEGVLDNQPIVWNHLWPGDTIRFLRQNIIDFEYRDDTETPAQPEIAA